MFTVKPEKLAAKIISVTDKFSFLSLAKKFYYILDDKLIFGFYIILFKLMNFNFYLVNNMQFCVIFYILILCYGHKGKA